MPLQTIDRGTPGNPSDTFKVGTAFDTCQANDQYLDVNFANVAALRAAPSLNQIAHTAGYTTAGDGGAGEYWLDASDTTSADNGFTVIVAADGGRWKLQRTNGEYNIQQAGAMPDSSASATYTAIARCFIDGVDSVVVPANGDYVIAQELVLPHGFTLIGKDGASIVQDTYGYAGVQLRNQFSAVKNLTIRNDKPKTALSTTVPNRYDGEVQRSRASGIYVAASNCTVKSIYCPGFINGINLVGGERVWATTSGTFTATTLVLNASSVKPDDYYNGWNVRIFSTSNATATVIVSDYDSATNTITFPIVSTFTGPYYYLLVGNYHTGNRVYEYKGNLNDFGILAQYQDDLIIDDIDQEVIEQTQELNARPHTVYFTTDVTNFFGSRWRTQSCANGHAYKFRAVNGAVLTDISSRSARAVLAIEESSRFYVDGCAGYDIGTATFRPECVNVVSSDDVTIKNITLRIASTFDYASNSALRPTALAIGDSAYTAVTKLTVTGVDTNCRGADQAFGVFIEAPSTGTHANITVDGISIMGDGTCSTGATVPVSSRAFSVDKLKINGITHTGSDTPTLVLESSTSNCTASFVSNFANPTVTNSGTGNTIWIDGEQRSTFTPVIVGATSAGTGTYTVQAGRISKIGRRIFGQMHVAWTAHTGTGNMRIGGLPFNSIATANAFASVTIGQVSDVAMTAGNYMTGIVNTNSSQIILYQTPTGGGASGFVPMDTAGTLTISFSYES